MADNEKNHIILKDLSYQIVAAAFEVHNTLTITSKNFRSVHELHE
jgi:hypothetical protein